MRILYINNFLVIAKFLFRQTYIRTYMVTIPYKF
nr:MAG TPA: hypothetical protein [Caudoviricetes sp.]